MNAPLHGFRHDPLPRPVGRSRRVPEVGLVLILALTFAGPAGAAEEDAWTVSAALFGFFVPESRDILSPVITADRGPIHVEARANYEAYRSGSVWLGYNLHFGEKVSFDLTPMAAGVFGEIGGIAPGIKAYLAWWKLEISNESEYVIDLNDPSENFFYSWSEASIAPVDWFRAGLAVQRTKLYETEIDIQRGFLVGFSGKKVGVTAYLFNPDEDDPTGVLALAADF